MTDKVKAVFVSVLVKLCPLHFLIAAVKEIGWGIRVEADGDDVIGFSVGADAFLEKDEESIREDERNRVLKEVGGIGED